MDISPTLMQFAKTAAELCLTAYAIAEVVRPDTGAIRKIVAIGPIAYQGLRAFDHLHRAWPQAASKIQQLWHSLPNPF